MYKALYRKFRPTKFEEIIGQEHISLTLKNELINNHVSHAYLFAGSRGVGKTTTAKILAKALNCEKIKDGEPCCKCSICEKIDTGSIPDVQEIDAASSTGVDNIRMVREDAQFAPVVGRTKVYIIDEAHMLSTGAFNALLKIMEEPPKKVVFILATTQINKIPATILSRCQRFDFLKPSIQTIGKLIVKVASEDGIAINGDAVEMISILADGGMRDALSLLDVCKSVCNGKVIDEALVEAVAAVPTDLICLELFETLVNKDLENSLRIINECYMHAMNMASICKSLVRNCRNILLLKLCKKELNFLEIMPKNLKKMQEIADKITQSQIINILEGVKSVVEKTVDYSMIKIELELCAINLCNSFFDTVDNGINFKSDNQFPNKMDLNSEIKLKNWQKVLDVLSSMDFKLADTLSGSSAYLKDEIVFIDYRNNLFLDLIRENEKNKEILKNAIEVVMGKRYRIGPYKRAKV